MKGKRNWRADQMLRYKFSEPSSTQQLAALKPDLEAEERRYIATSELTPEDLESLGKSTPYPTQRFRDDSVLAFQKSVK